MTTAFDLSQHFLAKDWHWTFDGESRIPTENEVAENLDKSVAVLYDKADGTSLLVGGMMVHKTAGHYDVYAHMGEWKEKENDNNDSNSN